MVEKNSILYGDFATRAQEIPDEFVDMCMVSPPYFGLRNYDVQPTEWPVVEFKPVAGLSPLVIPKMKCCLGLENDPWAYVGHIVFLFREVRRILKSSGTLWFNIGDSYAGGGRAGNDPAKWPAHKMFGKQGFRTGYMGKPQPVPQGLKKKDMQGIPWRVAFALQADGWWLRQDIIWSKPNPMPESVTDRCTKSHEYVFLFSKSEKYYFDYESLKETAIGAGSSRPSKKCGEFKVKTGSMSFRSVKDRRNKRSVWYVEDTQQLFAWLSENYPDVLEQYFDTGVSDVWDVKVRPYKGLHFAVFPEDLITPCITAGCPPDGIVFDPMCGSGTTLAVAKKLGRGYLGVELNAEENRKQIEERLYRAVRQKSFENLFEGNT